MKLLRAIIIFAIIPLIAGYFVASSHANKATQAAHLNFTPQNVQKHDQITLVENGTIISLTQKGVVSIPTHIPQLIEALPLGNNFIGVDKRTNYSSLDEFSTKGKLIKTLQNGTAAKIDSMDWFTDPAINPNQTKIAFVSDMDKSKTNVLDNALFVENVTGSIQKIANPDPHSGGIAHPVWDPANPQNIIYDYYQYDNNFNPYSVIDEYNFQTQNPTQLTTRKQNAYQGSFSPNGKQLIFLERNNNITTKMVIADVTANGLAHTQTIAEGDFAYPEFSNTKNHIYYLEAQGNSGYDLYTATLANGKLTNAMQVSTGEQLLANSGFVVNEVKK